MISSEQSTSTANLCKMKQQAMTHSTPGIGAEAQMVRLEKSNKNRLDKRDICAGARISWVMACR